MSYATIEQLGEYLEEVVTTGASGDKLENVLDRANAIVDEFLGFTFAGYTESTGTDTERDVRGQPGPYLWLPAHKQGSITAVAIVNNFGLTGESETAATGWKELSDGRLYRSTAWGDTWYRVTGEWGYGDAPTALVQIELEIAVNLWQAKKAGRFSDVVGVEGGGAVGYAKALTDSQRMVLEQVRRRYGGEHLVW